MTFTVKLNTVCTVHTSVNMYIPHGLQFMYTLSTRTDNKYRFGTYHTYFEVLNLHRILHKVQSTVFVTTYSSTDVLT